MFLPVLPKPRPMLRVPLLVPAFLLALTASLWQERETPAGVAPADSLLLDSARAEMAAGRSWHAARLLEPLEQQGRLDREGLLLQARARAGYRDWAGAAALLDRARPGDGDFGGWFLLARAREATGAYAAAAEAYQQALGSAGPATVVVQGRRARVLWRAGERDAALRELDGLASASRARSWLALELLARPVEVGDTGAVGALLSRITTPEARSRSWDARARARWQAGDTAGAVAEYRALLATEVAPDRQARAWLILGRTARAAGDSVAAWQAFLQVVELAPGGGSAGPAAAALVDLGGLDAGQALAVARILDRTGDGQRALRAYDRHVALAGERGTEPDARARVERARLMATVPERQDEAIREYRALSTHPEPEVGARALDLWAGLRRRQGRLNDEATLERWLVERYPGTAAATEVVFFRADAAHDGGDVDRALEAYGQVVEMAPALDLAGLSRMRMGQILLRRDRLDEALAVYEGYLEDFPRGRRWDEAAYWAARIRLALDDAPGGMNLLERLHAEEPFSYYTVLTADLLDRPFAVDSLPPGPDTPVPAWVEEGLAELDVLDGLGLTDARAHHGDLLAERARQAADPVALYAVAEGLNARGRTLDGINLGWELRRKGEPWSLRLLQIVYPFPYREMVLREAREWGVDPFLLAGLIRQESAWVADIVSSAGAVGLMQVMPATGRGLARDAGLEGFTEASLETPEVNLHLGARFLVDVLERYGPDLPLVLAAYNAGPARADRWRAFPEAGDPLHLTERIPFGETRGYVKNVTRNQRLYEALYGGQVRVAR